MITPDPARSRLLYGNQHHALADGTTALAVRVKLRDSLDRPVPGRQVELAADRSGVTIQQPGLTDEQGYALGFVRATTPGYVNISGAVLPVEA